MALKSIGMKVFNPRTQKRAQNNEVAAFESLFREFYAPLCRYAAGFLGDMDAAEEITQEFFYNYWKNREGLLIKTTLKGYLFQSIRNNCLKYLEHEGVKRRYAMKVMAGGTKENQDTQDGILEAKDLQRIIDQTLHELPERCGLIFRMSRFEGLKYQEIARELSISVKTVEANMGKALQLFRVKLKKYREFAY
ncbi:MAG: RNA polymerase sigma-70 factor [Bacteroidales bacterium]